MSDLALCSCVEQVKPSAGSLRSICFLSARVCRDVATDCEGRGGVIQVWSICNGVLEHAESSPDWNNMVHKWCSMLRFKSHILVLKLFPLMVQQSDIGIKHIEMM